MMPVNATIQVIEAVSALNSDVTVPPGIYDAYIHQMFSGKFAYVPISRIDPYSTSTEYVLVGGPERSGRWRELSPLELLALSAEDRP